MKGLVREMGYVVLDLEWNQAMSSKSSVFNKLPFHLRGEIIQIGAVKLDENMCPGDEFQVDVKPVFFKRMHHKVKKLTGFDKARLQNGEGFVQAMERFRSWCGDDCTFFTWGYDDRGIMEQNIMLHDLDWDWITDWVNLQVIFNLQTDGDKNQKALSTAMEHFDIEQTRTAHDALGDAYNTALVASRLDMGTGLGQYHDARVAMAENKARIAKLNETRQQGSGSMPIDRTDSVELSSRTEAFENPELTTFACPECGSSLKARRWVNQGDKRYMSLVSCEKHGSYLIRLKFKKNEFGVWSASRLIYKADCDTEEFFRAKAVQVRRRRKRYSRPRKSN